MRALLKALGFKPLPESQLNGSKILELAIARKTPGYSELEPSQLLEAIGLTVSSHTISSDSGKKESTDLGSQFTSASQTTANEYNSNTPNITEPEFIQHMQKVLEKEPVDEIILYHIDTTWAEYDYLKADGKTEANVKCHKQTNEAQIFIESIFESLDKVIDLDFERVGYHDYRGVEEDEDQLSELKNYYDDSSIVNCDIVSDIDIYSVDTKYSNEYEHNWARRDIGEALSLGRDWDEPWWDILWRNTNPNEKLNSIDKSTIVHEIGHALGLSHPNGDGLDPNFTSADTIMSYRHPMGTEYGSSKEGWPIGFSDLDLKTLKKLWGAEDDITVDNQTIINEIDNTYTAFSKVYEDNSDDYKFYSLGEGRYALQSKTGQDIDEITGVSLLRFSNQDLTRYDIKATFDQVTGINDASGIIFRLYNAAFGRLPDAAGFKNWINVNSSGKKTYKETAKAFAESQEFANCYGANLSNTDFVTILYNNVLDRDPDPKILAKYVGELNDGTNERKDLLYIISESPESRGLFTDTTGLS
ncbi:DUF4214 domain-containing protein [Prochlorococcus marinus]|uniref:DUF4214 domain-containing protein n=1 Tax=Prochlorococcus TaxID=1218 RepID=UPI0007B3CF52|nr:DUF4214 domain-containing protein [Prochlorococcus marinus]